MEPNPATDPRQASVRKIRVWLALGASTLAGLIALTLLLSIAGSLLAILTSVSALAVLAGMVLFTGSRPWLLPDRRKRTVTPKRGLIWIDVGVIVVLFVNPVLGVILLSASLLVRFRREPGKLARAAFTVVYLMGTLLAPVAPATPVRAVVTTAGDGVTASEPAPLTDFVSPALTTATTATTFRPTMTGPITSTVTVAGNETTPGPEDNTDAHDTTVNAETDLSIAKSDSADTTNTFTTTAQPSDGAGVPLPGIGPVSDQDVATVDVVAPAIQVVKTANPTLIHPGETVVYTYTVTNPGDDPLSNISVSDNAGAPGTGCSPLSFTGGDINGNSLLDPGENWTYTCSTAINTDTTNIVTASGTDSLGNSVSDNDSAFVDVVTPAVDLMKSANPTVILSGDTVQYAYLASNTGDVPLTNVSVTDNHCAPVTGPDSASDTNGNGLLDPGETWRYFCVTAVNADTTNTATVSGQPSDDTGVPLAGISPISDQDSTSVDVVTPAIQVVKTTNPQAPAVIYAGETVVYTFTVTNTGDTPLANPGVSDDACWPVLFQEGDTDGDGLLDTTETWAYTCSIAVTQDITDTATATGQPSNDLGAPLPGIGPVTDQDTASVNVINPAINIVKTASAPLVNPGDIVTYTYEVTNAGDDPLTSVSVSDDACASPTLQGGDTNSNDVLDVGETWTYSCSTTVSEDTTNTATATGTDSLGSPVSDQDSAFVDALIVGIEVDKTASDTTIYAGDTVTYTYVVSNTGSDPLHQVVVTDTAGAGAAGCSPVLYQSGDTSNLGELDVGETWIYQCITAVGVDTANTAIVSALNPLTQTVSDQGAASVNVINPAIQVDKSADKSFILAGDLVQYSYRVTNPGDDPLSNVKISDNACNSPTFTGGDSNSNSLLDPGETWTYACSAVVNSDTTNVATASGTDSLGNPVSDNDSAFVNVVAPSVNIVKSANRTVVLAGETVQYSYLARNTGDVPLANVSVTDDGAPGTGCAPVTGPGPAGDTDDDGLLDPGEIWSYSCVTIVNTDTANTATVSGQPSDDAGIPLPGINPVSAQDTTTVDVVTPAIQVVKSADPTTVYAGETVVYTFTVTNPGDTPLANTTITDTAATGGGGCSPLLFQGGDTDGDGLLDSTETWTYTCSSAVAQDTASGQPLVDIATATGRPSDDLGAPLPGINPVNDQDTAFVDVINPAINIVKTPGDTLINPGDTVTYTYQVINSGDDPLSNVTVSDDAGGGATGCSPVTLLTSDGNGLLDPGETWIFQCTTVVTDDTTNTATATATDSLGSPVSAHDTAFVDTVQAAIDLVKTADPVTIYAGQTVTYTYTVDNIGSDPIFNILLSDPACTPLVFQGGDTDSDGVLDVGESWTYICTANPTADTTNTAEVAAEDAFGQPVRDADAANVNVINPDINVLKTADPAVVLSGDLVQYTYEATNPGDDPLANVSVSDEACSPLVFDGGDVNANSFLDPGETWTYTCSANPTVDITNTVTGTGTDSLGTPVSDNDTATVDVVAPAINVVKTAAPTVIQSGDTVVYNYQVTNPGDVPLSSVNVADDHCAPVSYVSGDTDGDSLLDPGETWRYSCVIAVAADTINIAIANGQPSDSLGVPLPGINPVSDQDIAAVDVVAPGLNLVKSVTPTTIYASQGVTYTYTVTNTGTPPLANATLTDDSCSPVSFVTGDTNPNGLLDPGETWVYTCTNTLFVDTLNTATASGQTSDVGGTPLPGIAPVSDQDTTFVDVINPAVDIVKTPNAILIRPGDLVTYTYQVINTGDDPLRGATVSDNSCSTVTLLTTDSNGLLDPGETWVFQCSRTLTDDTTNTATATVTDSLGSPVTAQDSAFVNTVQAAIDLVKSANPATIYAGQTVTYTLTVDNIGSDPIINVLVSDDACSPLGPRVGDTNDNSELDVGETWTYTCTTTLTADTVNTAMVSAQDALGHPLTDDDAADVNVINPAISIVKTADPPIILTGGLVQYGYEVTSPGDDPLSNISVSDDAGAPGTGCSPLVFDGGDLNVNSKLDPGETWLYSCSANPTADITNTVTITGNDSLGNPISDQDTATVDVLAPAVELTKIADPAIILAGAVVTYTYRVTNTGDLPLLSDVNVADDSCSPVSYVSGDADGDGLLDPGETWLFRCSTTVASDTTNTATVSGQPSDEAGVPLSGIDPVSDQNTATVDVVAPAINVEKTANPTTIYANNAVAYTYTVSNPGDVPLASVTVTDDAGAGGTGCSPLTGPDPAGDADSDGLLDLTETWVYTCTTTLATDTANTVTASGQPSDAGGTPLPGIDPVSDQTTAFVDVINPAIDILKTPNVTDAEPGNVITYTYRVTNTGDAQLHNVSVTDDLCNPVTLQTSDGNGLLDPGETWTYICAYTMQVTDPDPLVNTATVQATDSLGGSVQDTDQTSVSKIAADLTLSKSNTPDPAIAGDALTYTLVISNNGPSTAASVIVTDTLPSGVTFVSATPSQGSPCIPAGGTVTCNLGSIATSATVRIEVNVGSSTPGPLINVAQVSSSTPDPVSGNNLVSELATVNAQADLAVTKSDTPDPVVAGKTLTYTLTVTNNGPSDAQSVVVSDALPSEVIVVSAISAQGSCGTPDVTCTLGSLTSGSAATVTIVTAVSPGVSDTLLNTARVSSDVTDPNLADNSVNEPTVVLSPAIAVVKTAIPTIILSGDTVAYNYQVTNPGNTPLTTVNVTDEAGAGGSGCSPVTFVSGDADGDGLLDPGETWRYSCTMTVTEDITNTVTVSGQPSDDAGAPLPGIDPVSDQDTATVDVISPAIQVDKTADPTLIYAGETVLYTFTLTNPGDVPLANPTVSDDACAPLVFQSGDADGDGLLDPGEVWVYTCNAVVTQDTGSGQPLVNTASASGQPSDGLGAPLPGIGPVNDQDTASVNVISPAISIVKTPSAALINPGGPVTYTYEVINTGDDPLTNVSVSDDDCGPVTFSGGDANGNNILDVGETWTYSCSTTLAEDTANTATTTGTDSLGSPVTAQGSAFVDVVIAGIQVDKTANDQATAIIYPGDTVTYTYVVSNTGSDPLHQVVITDTIGGPATGCSPVVYLSGDTDTDNELDVGETWIYQCVTAVNVDTTNTATASALDPLDQAQSDQASANVDVINPAIQVDKAASKTVILTGETVVYTYTVTNPGDDPLSNVSITDTACSPLSSAGGDRNSNSLLDPGETWTYSCSTTINADITNIVTVTGDDSLGNPTSDSDSAFVDVVAPSIQVAKGVDRTVVLSGDTVRYTYLASNTGDVPLASVSMTDTTCAPVTGPDPTGDTNGNGLLDPGETWSYSCVTAVISDTTNTATVSGQPSDAGGAPLPGIAPISGQDTASVDVVAPAIQITKTADPTLIYAGETVVYTFTLTNPGDVPLTNPTVSDDAGAAGSGCSPILFQGGDTDGDGLLDTTETWTYTCARAVTQGTASGQPLVNTATATGQPSDDLGAPLPGIGPVTEQDTASVDVINPAISIVKVPSAALINPGDTVTYTYEVTNPGDDPLSSVSVSDAAGAPGTGCTPLTFTGGDTNSNSLLDPGETWTYSCSSTLSNDTANTAVASGTDSLGSLVSDQDTAFVDVVIAGIQVDKAASNPIVYAGDTVTYTYAVSNTGSDPLHQIVVTDTASGPATGCSPVLFQSGDTDSDGELDPDETWTYECATTVSVDTVNTAVVSALDPLTQTVSDQGSASVNVINPAIQVDKTTDKAVILAGDLVQYTYQITNPGDDPLSNVSISDDAGAGGTGCSPLAFVSGDADGDSLLDPDETWTYSCSAVVNTDTTNVVTVSGHDSLGNPVSDQDSASVDVVAPAVNIVKIADPTVILAGETVQYTYLASNTGDTPLANVTVADDAGAGGNGCAPVTGPDPAGDTDGDGLLDPGETWSFSCVTTVNRDSINTATVSGQPSDDTGVPLPGIVVVSDQDTASVNVVAPAIQVAKTADPTLIYAGETVVYTFTLTNPGDTPLANPAVSDALCSPLLFQSGDTDGDGLLDPDETWTFTCSTPVTQDTLNTATASGQPSDALGAALPGINPVNGQDTAFVNAINPAISIVKTPSAALMNPGDTVTYTYAVINTGDDPLTSVNVSDNACGLVTLLTSDGNGLLDPGETWVFQCSTTLTHDTTNTALATATDSLGGPVSAQDSAFVDTVQAAIGLVKIANPAVIYAGQTVTYTYTVDNIGSDPIFNVLVSDDAGASGTGCTPLTFTGGDTNGDGVLDMDETWIYTCSTTVSNDTTDTAVVTARDALGQPLRDDDAASVNVINPAINVAKSADHRVILAGDLVQYTYQLTNPGDDWLSNVTVNDDTCNQLIFGGGDLNGNARLDPGETWTYTCSTNPTADTTNTVTASGHDSLGNPVSDNDTASVDVVAPAVDILKTADPATVLAGSTVQFTFVVSNTGDTPLTSISIADNTCAPVTGPDPAGDTDGDGLLDPGETWRYSCVTTVKADTTNTATVSGQPSDEAGLALPGINPVSDQDTTTVDVVTPRINVTKRANPTTVYAGDSVLYTYEVINTGDVPLANPHVTDDVCSPLSFVAGDTNTNSLLDPGETWSYTCSTAVAGDTLNTATASGQPSDDAGTPLPGINPVSDQDTTFVDVINPDLTVVKSPSAIVVLPGTVVTYTYQVINSGDVQLDNVSVADDTCSPVTLLTSDGNGLLDPGETWLFQCATTLTDDTTNTATASADDPLGGVVSDQDTTFVDVVRAGLSLDKAASAAFVYASQTVSYTYFVQNTSSDPVFSVVVTDDAGASGTGCSPVTYVSGDTNSNSQLDPGEVWIYGCSTTLADDTTNVATVTGEDSLGTPLTPDQAAATVDVINPAINVLKTAYPAVILAGQLVQYIYQVTNPGDDPLANLSLTDNACSPLVFDGGDLNANARLDPGETWTYRCSANATADITNTVTAAGNDSLGNPVSDQDSATVDVVAPAINVVKAANPAVILAGQVVTYTYSLTNAGDTPLSEITIADDTCSPVTFVSGDTDGNGLLTPDETWTYICSTALTTDTTNTATATGQPSDDAGGLPLSGISPVSHQDTAFVDVVAPHINTIKIANPTTIYANDSVSYTYEVINNGDVPLANPSVTDDAGASGSGCSPVTFTAGDTNGNTLLDPGETWSYTCLTTLVADTLNTVTATGQPSDGGGTPLPDISPVSDQDTAFVDVINPAITLVKTASVSEAAPGDVITYIYQVANTGDNPLDNVSVTDNAGAPGTGCSPVTRLTADGNGLLDPGQTWTYTCAYTVQATDSNPLVNTASVQATDSLGGPVQATDQASVSIVTADLTITKSDSSDPVLTGQTLTYTLVITNDGPSDASAVMVTDTLPTAVTFVSSTPGLPTCTESSGTVTCALGTLSNGSSAIITTVVTVDPPTTGTITNTSVVTADEFDPNTANNTDTESTTVNAPMPGVAVEKILESDDAQTEFGTAFVAGLITFTIRITNTGNTTLMTVPLTDTYDTLYLTFASAVPEPDVVMTDTGQLIWHDLTGAPPGGFGADLPPNAVFVVQVVMEAIHFTPPDVKAENTAVVDNVLDEFGEMPPDIPDDDSVSVAILPNIAVDKRAEVEGPVDVGDAITFTIWITNIGTADIVTLPLSDTYNPAFLGFVGADPSQDHYTPGSVEWNDLTGPPPGGFDIPLAADQSFRVTVVFTAVAAADPVTNTALIEGGLDINDEPVNGFDDEPIIIQQEPTAAVLRSFTATTSGHDVTLRWETVTEIDNLGFNVWRSAELEDGYQRVNRALIPSQALGTGGTSYEFVDRGVPDGTWYYKLETISTAGQTADWHGPILVQVGDIGRGLIYLPLLIQR